MKKILLFMALLLAAKAGAQSFPYDEAFTSYTPGSTGAPVWSVFGGAWRVADGALQGPVTARFNARPPKRFVVEAAFRRTGDGEAGFVFDMQRENGTDASDTLTLRSRNGVAAWEKGTLGPASAAWPAPPPVPAPADPGDTLHVRLVVDAAEGRYALFSGDNLLVTSAPCEYAAGLAAVRAGEGMSVTSVSLRAPTVDEAAAVAVRTLFNDPRDAAPGEDGTILVLHRDTPAIVAVNFDGDVVRSYGRRISSGIPDAVAMASTAQGTVYVLNRFPAQVVMFDRNGGIRRRFGTDHLTEPADVAVLPNGTVAVADAGGKRVVLFGPDGGWQQDINKFGDTGGVPARVAVDAGGDLVVTLADAARTVALRAGGGEPAVLSSLDARVSDVATTHGKSWGLWNAAVHPSIKTGEAVSFGAKSIGGLGPDGRLVSVRDAVYALDRANARLVAVPPDMAEADPTVSFLNIAQSAALVQWSTPTPTLTSKVRILRGSTWDVVTQRADKPSVTHQVTVERLKPGTRYAYAVWPLVSTIPATDWSQPLTFGTAGTMSVQGDPSP